MNTTQPQIKQLHNRTVISAAPQELQHFAEIAKQAGKLPVYAGSVDIHQIRASGLQFADSELAYPVPDSMQRRWVDANGVKACWFWQPEYQAAAPVLYLHGGGYVGGSVEASRGIAAKLAESLCAPVLAVDYRQGPEQPYPAAIEDTISAYQWLMTQTELPITIAGDSAGGTLAVGMGLHAARENLRPARGVIAMSAWFDYSLTGYSWLANRDKDLVSAALGQTFVDAYLQGTNPADAVSFIFDQIELSPPLLVQMGSIEGPFDSAVAYVERARATGVSVDFEVYTDMPHNFSKFRSAICDTAYARIKQWAQNLNTPSV